MLTFLTGFFAGFAHVFSGPDHLAAVTPFSIDFRKKAWVIGFLWGLGHTLGALLIGLVFLLFRELFPIDIVSRYSEKIVGIMLLLIGGWALSRLYLKPLKTKHAHPHIHKVPAPFMHVHRHEHGTMHVHSLEHEHDHPGAHRSKRPLITALAIGMIHGFAGFSHLLAVLPSLILPSKSQSIIYLSAFGVGTVLTMIAYTFTLGSLAYKLDSTKRIKFLHWVSFTGGIAAIIIGMIWMVRPF